jgi:hypothetical protein
MSKLPLALIASGLIGGLLLLNGGKAGPGPSPLPSPSDAVSTAFDQYETLWRATQLEAAKKLESGEFTTSQQVTKYRSLADGEAIKASRDALLKAEFADHGGEKWTDEKAAKYLRGYAR